MAEVTLSKVVKRYDDVEAVKAIDLAIAHNEFVVLVGPSGCGKSTTLRMIAGLEEISDGEIRIGDRVVNDLPPRARNISMVFQNYALYPHMTVAENLGFSLKIAKQPKAVIQERVAWAAGILGLQDLLDRRAAQLSGGQRQRVAMGRAIVRNPDVFLFDEPLSNLDAKLRVQMRTEIKRLHQKVRTTVIYVTHDQVEAMTLADRIVIMRDGLIEQVGAPEDVFNTPATTFVAGFIGSPPMNLIDAEVVSGVDGIEGAALKIKQGALTVPVPSHMRGVVEPGQSVVVGLRAEDLTPVGHGWPMIESREVEGIVNIAEPLGTETLMFVDLQGIEVQSKMFNPKRVGEGERLMFDVNLGAMHLFDGETGRRIEPSSAPATRHHG